MNIEFFFDPSDQEQLPVRLRQVSHYTADDHRRSGCNTMDFWTIDVSATDGGATRVGSGGWLPRSPGWVHLYRPGSFWWHDTSGVKTLSHEAAFALFDGGAELGLLPLTDCADGFARIHDPGFLVFNRLCAMAELMVRGGRQRTFGALAELYAIADLLRTGCVRIPGAPPCHYQLRGERLTGAGDNLAGRVFRLLYADCASEWTLELIAARLKVSVSTLTHEYRKEAGESVISTLHSIRLQQGRRLLLQGTGVKEAAQQVGFRDENYFSKLFHRRFGTSPGLFRKQAGGC